MSDERWALLYGVAGTAVLFLALFAGLRWSPEPAPERGYGEPTASEPFGLTYPSLLADSVVRVVLAVDRNPAGAPGHRDVMSLWRRLDSDGNLVSSYTITTREDGSVSHAVLYGSSGVIRSYNNDQGCTELRFEGLRREDRPPGSPLVFFDTPSQGWQATDPPQIAAFSHPQHDPRANLRWDLAEAQLSWRRAPNPLFPGATLGQHLVVGFDSHTQLIMVFANRIPSDAPTGGEEELMDVFLLIERFDRVPGLQAMREAVNLDELCRE